MKDRTDWAAIKIGRLRIHRRCQLCNGTGHHAPECWLLPHERYVGLIQGRISASKRLTRIDRERHPMDHTPDELLPIYQWAHAISHEGKTFEEAEEILTAKTAKPPRKKSPA